jgi:hypothetical protein
LRSYPAAHGLQALDLMEGALEEPVEVRLVTGNLLDLV